MERNAFAGITDSIASVLQPPPMCERCHSGARVNGGECLSCLLQAGISNEPECDDASFDAVLAEVDVRDREWRLGNYEILEEIGRGGMGVIYRARQRHTKRIVALKRVLSYHADSRETLERFRREAEAAASLDHPNILPIFDVGEADGLPFFTMKYATGGSLHAAAPALRRQPRACVRLMAKVTRAVAHAHGQGILHRDLKPGNILLDSCGEPMVSDFGLAKWIEAESDLTRSLAIFGTPGFIAPEQARGRRESLSAAADVYSLGAILFDLLAGRPPFLGEHALAVIHQAAERSAPRLRSLVPDADRDLETICAKCLEREPQARYRSAADLAEDLERWLEGRPISARPLAVPLRIWRSARRNPTLAASIAGCILLAGIGIAAWADSSHFRALVRQAEVARHSVGVAAFEEFGLERNAPGAAAVVGQALEAALRGAAGIHLRPLATHGAEMSARARAEAWKEIGRSSQVRLIVSGNVRERDGQFRIVLHLIDAASGAVVSTSLHDVESLSNFGADLAPTLARRMQDGELARTKPTESLTSRNPEALSHYERGKELYFRFNFPDLDRAIASLRKAIELERDYAPALALLANACQLRSILEPEGAWLSEAEDAARRALQAAPLLADAHFAAAGIQERRGHLKAALDDYLTAYQLDPGSARIAALIGQSYRLLGRPDVAISWLERAMRFETRPIHSEGLGHALLALGEWDAAEEAYRNAAVFRPDLPTAQLNFARLALGRGDFAAARRHCAEARAAHPTNSQPLLFAAAVEFLARDFRAAEQLYREALAFGRRNGLELDGPSVGILSALGYINRDSAAGLALLREALAADQKRVADAPDNPHYLYHLAATEAAMNNRSAALKALERAIDSGWLDHHSVARDARFDSVRETKRFEQQFERVRMRLRELRSPRAAIRDGISRHE